MVGWGGGYGATAGDDDAQDMALDGGGWDVADLIDTVISDAPVDWVTPYTGSAAAIDAFPVSDQYLQLI